MPVKIYLTGDAVGYDLSEYQLSPKPALKQAQRRFFSINVSQKKLIASAAIAAFYRRPPKHSICFGTFTFRPDYNPYYNDQISYFFEQITRYKECSGYLWTKELTKQGVIHYHAIFTLPTYKGVNITLNKYWCNARGYYTANAFQTDPKNGLIIKSPLAAAGYAAKYASKSGGQQYPTPAYRISRNYYVHPVKVWTEKSEDALKFIEDNRVPINKREGIDSIYTDYAEIFKISQVAAKKIFESVGEL